MRLKVWWKVLLVAGFSALLGLLGAGLGGNPQALTLATKAQPLPTFRLPDLFSEGFISNIDLRTDKPYYLINFWGSWCPQCYTEHAFLMDLAKTQTIIGVNWKDDPIAAKQFLAQGGNPFTRVLVDAHSELAIGMGVYGAPETFLIAADGTIQHRYAGALNTEVWQAEFVPRMTAPEAP